MPTEFPLPRGFQPAPVPDRLAFRIGGALGSRPSYLAVQTGFKTASAPGRLTLRIGVSAASRTPISGFGGQGSVQLSYGNVVPPLTKQIRRQCMRWCGAPQMNSRSKGGPGAASYSTMQRKAASGWCALGGSNPVVWRL